jgi:hypothetical protein
LDEIAFCPGIRIHHLAGRCRENGRGEALISTHLSLRCSAGVEAKLRVRIPILFIDNSERGRNCFLSTIRIALIAILD